MVLSASIESSEDLGKAVFSPLHVGLVGRSKFICDLNETIDRLADTSLAVFITGETGTGKDIIARLLHQRSFRRSKPFVKVNCPAVPGQLLESELFGYEKGSFSGAYTAKPGRFELASGGTVFLDEIAEISEASQIKLIQVLDGEPFMRVGGVEPMQSDARVVAATNVPLEDAVENGRLRKDIRYRLSEYVIRTVPLRDRPEDIALLTEHFNFNFSKRSAKEYVPISASLIRELERMSWHGNVRELGSRIREYVASGSDEALFHQENVAAPSGVAPVSDFPLPEKLSPTAQGRKFTSWTEAARKAGEETQRALIEAALRYTLWNRRKAARLLDTSYSSLLRRIDAYEIGKP